MENVLRELVEWSQGAYSEDRYAQAEQELRDKGII